MTPEQFEKVCQEIEIGSRGIRSICKSLGYDTSMFWQRRKENPELADRYARAKEIQAENQANELLEIADNLDLDPNHKRLMIDSRKWVAAKLLRGRYGDSLDVTSKGEAIKAYVGFDPDKIDE